MHSIISLQGLFLLGTVIGCGAAYAQSAGPDEAIGPDGKMAQRFGADHSAKESHS